jgi:hypothetical protein
MSNRIIAKVVKLKSVDDRIGYIAVGQEFSGFFTELPQIGHVFTLYNDNAQKLSDYIRLRTTAVREIIDDRTFRTKNSIYKITTIADERNDKINNLLQ